MIAEAWDKFVSFIIGITERPIYLLRKKPYVYHVSYNFINGRGSGNGDITIYRTEKIKTVEQVENVREFIMDHEGFESVVIYNWIRLKNEQLEE